MTRCYPKYNAVLDFQVITDLTTEPVTLAEVKRHLNMQFDTEGAFLFNDDDTYLTALIKECRQRLEKYTGLSFGEKECRAILRNDKGGIEIPYGPINNVYCPLDADGAEISGKKLRGIQFKWLDGPCVSYIDIKYNAGYETLPDDLKRAIKEEVAFRYKYRGDLAQEFANEKPGICEGAKVLCRPYRRQTIFA